MPRVIAWASHLGLLALMVLMLWRDVPAAALLAVLAVGGASLAVPVRRHCSPDMCWHLGLCATAMAVLLAAAASAPAGMAGMTGDDGPTGTLAAVVLGMFVLRTGLDARPIMLAGPAPALVVRLVGSLAMVGMSIAML